MHSTSHKKKKTALHTLAAVVLVCFVLFSLMATLFAVEHEHHNCEGNHCDICHFLQQIQQFARLLLPCAAAVVAGLVVFRFCRSPLFRGGTPVRGTLVSRKVQMNN